MQRRRVKLKPIARSTEDRADPLELITRMLGRSSYRQPMEGRGGTVLLMASDVAGAVGMMRDRLARETAMTVVKRGTRKEIARLSRMAYREVVRTVRLLRPLPLDLHKPVDRWRLRIVVYDATFELVYPERRQPYGQLAKAAKMRKTSYMTVHKCATAALQDAYNRAGGDLKHQLRGDAPSEHT